MSTINRTYILPAIGFISFALPAGSACADTFVYSCVTNGKSYPLMVDDARSILKWKDQKYKIHIQDGCAKFGWRAERPREAFDFCTATQGYADFEENGSKVQCDQSLSTASDVSAQSAASDAPAQSAASEAPAQSTATGGPAQSKDDPLIVTKSEEVVQDGTHEWGAEADQTFVSPRYVKRNFLEIKSRVDSVVIKGISVDRGNCPAFAFGFPDNEIRRGR